jgi:hypothetical protein
MKFFNNFGKREGLVYLIVSLWVIMGLLGAYKTASFADLAIYFGSLTAYAATYIWAEAKRPSTKSAIFKKGPNSRREVMIYVVVVIWAIAGAGAIWFKANIGELALYFVSLTGFVASWIAGEVYTPQDIVNKKNEE